MYYNHSSYRSAVNPNEFGRNKSNVMKVAGEGKVSIPPDKAEVSLGVSTEDQQLLKAQEENSKLISSIKNALNNIGIDDKEIRTVNFSIYPQYDYVEGKQIFRGYKVEHVLAITVNQIKNTGLVVDTAVSSGANIVSRIKFEVADYNRHYQQALSLAVIDAYQKAEAIAATLRVQLINTPLSVTESPLNIGSPVPFQATAFVKSETTAPIQSGTLEVASQITAEFAYYN